jgi:plasmid replication initiation protein
VDKNYIVTKSNKLICSYYSLTLQEHKIILTLISMVQPDDEDLKSYEFKIKTFIKLLGLKGQSCYSEIPRITKELMQKVFTIRDTEANETIQLAWLSSVKYNNNNGTVSLKFDSNLKPYILKLKEYYTSYKLSNILMFKSTYSIRVYEILKRYENPKKHISTIIIKLDELKKMAGANEKYFDKYANFKLRCIKPAQKELKKFSDIYFDFEEIKESRRVDAIKFNILKNNPEVLTLPSISENQEIDNNVTQDKSLKKSISSTALDDLKYEIENKIGCSLGDKGFKHLIDNVPTDTIKLYLDNWSKFTPGKNPVGFFINACIEKYDIPKTIYNKPIQATNYEQREYDDEFFDNLYVNLDNYKD